MTLRATSCKEAIAWFEKENGTKASEAKIVELRFQWPPLQKMDQALSTLRACEATSCKEAIAWFEKENGTKASEAKIVELRFQWPPLQKMDQALSTLRACEKLNLSSNMIDKINGIASMKNLKILWLDHNYIKSLDGVETVADTLEQLYINYNCIKMLKYVDTLKKLEILHIANNKIEAWPEFNRLQQCPALKELAFAGNPIVETESAGDWRCQVTNRLKQVIMLDGIPLKWS